MFVVQACAEAKGLGIRLFVMCPPTEADIPQHGDGSEQSEQSGLMRVAQIVFQGGGHAR